MPQLVERTLDLGPAGAQFFKDLVSADGGHLPVDDREHAGMAWAALHGGFRGRKYQGPDKEAAIAKLRALYAKHGWPLPHEAASDGRDDEPDHDEDDEDDREQRRAAGETSPGGDSTHVDAPVNTEPPRRKRSHYLRHLMTGIKSRLAARGHVRADEVDDLVHEAHRHATRMGIRDARGMSEPPRQVSLFADMPYDVGGSDGTINGDDVCEACAGGRHHECMCDACAMGDPANCQCQPADESPLDGARNRPEHYSDDDVPGVYTDAGECFQLYVPVSCAEAPEWIPFLPPPGTFKHPKFGRVRITKARNDQFVQQFNTGVYQDQVPLDAEHQTKLSGAMGWIKKLRQNSDGSVDARVNWTKRGIALVEDNRFRYVSPEFYEQWTDPATEQVHRNVVIGGALTTRPFFKSHGDKGLRPLVASERAWSVPDEGAFVTEEGDTGMAIDAKRFAELEDEVATLRQERLKSQQMVEAAQVTARQASERLAAMERDSRLRQFTEEATRRGVEVDPYVALCESLDDDQLKAFHEVFDPVVKQRNTGALFSEAGVRGRGANSVENAIEAAAVAKRQQNPRLTKEQAYAEALADNPGLYDQATSQTFVDYEA